MIPAEAPDAHEPRLRALLWNLLGRFVVRATPHNWNPVRRVVLRACGARLAPSSKVRRSARIDRPWNLEIGDLAVVGDDAVLRARSPIRIGDRSVISQRSILTTEVRDPRRAGRASRTAPITIGDDCWIATDTLVLPGSRVGAGTVVGARGLVAGTLPEWTVATGEPAIPRGARALRSPAESDQAPTRRV